MKPKSVYSLLAVLVLVSATALAQAGGASSPALPAAPSSASDPPALGANATGSKIGAINVEQAIVASNEGQRDFDVLSKSRRPWSVRPRMLRKTRALRKMRSRNESCKRWRPSS